MKTLWAPILLLVAGCGSGVHDEKPAAHDDRTAVHDQNPASHNDKPAVQDEKADESLKSGEVTQVAFTSDGKNLVVVNQYRLYGNLPRQNVHSRLRSFSTAAWKVTGETGELSVSGLNLAPSAKQPWLISAEEIDRFGRGNPRVASVCYQVDPVTLKVTKIDLIQKARHREYAAYVRACAPEQPLCVAYVGIFASPGPLEAPFIFDLKQRKKTVTLQDVPTGNGAPGHFAGPALGYAPHGKKIASFERSEPYQMQFHDANTGKLLKSMKVKSPVGVIEFSPDGKLLAAMCQDGTLLILQPDLSGQIASKRFQEFAFEVYGRFPKPVAFAGNGLLAVISTTTTVDLLDTKEWKSTRTFKMNEVEKNRINCVAGSPNGKLLAVGFGRTALDPGLVRIWDTGNGKLVKELK